MSDTRELLAAAARLREAGEPFLLATVVGVRGSSYRRPGARMLLTPDRWVAGSVSGGCLEGDIVKKSSWRLRDARAALVRYDSRRAGEEAAADPVADDVEWGFGLGCEGVVDVLVERVDARAPGVDALGVMDRCVRGQSRGALVTVFRSADEGTPVGARLALFADGATEVDPMREEARRDLLAHARAAYASDASAHAVRAAGVDALVEVFAPPPRLFLFGAGHDALPVVTIARTLGWEVIIYEPHARWATRERFAQADQRLAADPEGVARSIDASACAVAVVMGHNYEHDRAHLAILLATRARYIGMLGPRRRTERMLVELGHAPGDLRDPRDPRDPRIHAPVGLELGAETPPEIALAIVAEIQSTLARTTAASLRQRPGPIHDAADAAE